MRRVKIEEEQNRFIFITDEYEDLDYLNKTDFYSEYVDSGLSKSFEIYFVDLEDQFLMEWFSSRIENDIYEKILSLNREVVKLPKMEITDEVDFEKFKHNLKQNLKIFKNPKYDDTTNKQLEKVYMSTRLENVSNFSEPGSGKTLMTLMTHFERERQYNQELDLIIICPINAIMVWKREIQKFTNIDERYIHIFRKDYENENFENKKYHQIAGKKVLITNYSMVNNLDDDNYKYLFNKSHVVLDEVHRVKSVKAKHGYVKNFIKNSITRTILTGTPYSTSISEIEAILNLAWNYSIPTISPQKFIRYSERVRNDGNSDPLILKKINDDLSKYYFKMSKYHDFGLEDAIDNFENPINVKPLDIQLTIDEFVQNKISNIIAINSDNLGDPDIMKKLGKWYGIAMMSSVNPMLIKDKEEISFLFKNFNDIEFGDLPKIKASFEFVKDYLKKEKKIIVWFRYRDNIEKFTKLLNENGIRAKFINGSTKTHIRESVLKSFANPENEEIQVLVSNPDTIAESISLHESVFCSLFVEQGFSYYQWAQAKDRIHRVGSPEDKDITHNYVRNEILNIDKKIFNNLLSKKRNNDALFDGALLFNNGDSQLFDDGFIEDAEEVDVNEISINLIDSFDENYEV